MDDDFGRMLRESMIQVPDFPEPGVLFLDTRRILVDPNLLAGVCERLAEPFASMGVRVVMGVEARGFYFASAVALLLGAGFIAVRKPAKLPPPVLKARGTISDMGGVYAAGGGASFATYAKPYEFEMSAGMLEGGARVLIVDDLLAKGGSADACVRLARQCEAEVVGCAFVVELTKLGGAARLSPTRTHSLLQH